MVFALWLPWYTYFFDWLSITVTYCSQNFFSSCGIILDLLHVLHCDPGSGIWRGSGGEFLGGGVLGGGGSKKKKKKNFIFFSTPPPRTLPPLWPHSLGTLPPSCLPCSITCMYCMILLLLLFLCLYHCFCSCMFRTSLLGP